MLWENIEINELDIFDFMSYGIHANSANYHCFSFFYLYNIASHCNQLRFKLYLLILISRILPVLSYCAAEDRETSLFPANKYTISLMRLGNQQINHQIFLAFLDMMSLAIKYHLMKEKIHICYLWNLNTLIYIYTDLFFLRRLIKCIKWPRPSSPRKWHTETVISYN